MKVLTDFHHAGLLQSFILLFEKRWGGEVYRPIGVEWFENGFWKIYDHPATVEQFLGIGGATPDGSDRLNEVVKRRENDVYLCSDINSRETNKAITLQGFFDQDFDIVIASIPQHIKPFRRLCEMHKNHPKLIYQIGNAWNIGPDEINYVKNFMVSAKIENQYPETNFISYHQEFDTNIFRPSTVWPTNLISSFVNCFSIDQLFADDWNLFQKVEDRMTDYKFRCFGGQCRDGSAHGNQQVAEFMQESKFVWHTKKGGDGYGHIIYNAGAVGKPLICKKGYYIGKLGEELMEDGVTCIAIDNLGVDEIINKIGYYAENSKYYEMCTNMNNRFKDRVNFENEAVKLRNFVDKLL